MTSSCAHAMDTSPPSRTAVFDSDEEGGGRSVSWDGPTEAAGWNKLGVVVLAALPSTRSETVVEAVLRASLAPGGASPLFESDRVGTCRAALGWNNP